MTPQKTSRLGNKRNSNECIYFLIGYHEEVELLFIKSMICITQPNILCVVCDIRSANQPVRSIVRSTKMIDALLGAVFLRFLA